MPDHIPPPDDGLKLLPDNAIHGVPGDRFGFAPHARVLCNALEGTEDLPLTVGIFGPWGTGKSSFMNVCRDLLRQRNVPTIWFNPWKYDRKDEVWHALIQTVLTEIASDLEKSRDSGNEPWRDRVTRTLATVKQLSRTAAWLLARSAVGPLSGGIVRGEDVDRLQETVDEQGTEAYAHVNRFEQDFRDVVRDYTGDGRLVLFIDDLDRCTQDAAITVLDSLKLFLGEASCVFVLAMDQQAITEAAAAKLKDSSAGLVKGQQYLEKLIHFPYHLPGVPFEALYRQFQTDIRPAGLASSRELWELVRVALGTNPRRVRRFINGLNLTAATYALHHQPPSVHRLLQAAVLLVLRMLHPAFFLLLQEDPEIWKRFNEAELRTTGPIGPDEVIDKQNPGVRRLLAAVSTHRDGFEFPPPPKAEELRLLTEVLTVTGGLPSAPDGSS
ncbi:P-loop NTPase fold protein [Streptomyces sp. NPDC053079]|uniref:KAP family P-loop NTPase fold protein n=1 Tax=Streptomyces sp. NPDC053079 TaxID=3365697 RepID=UPI0037D2A6B7